jgi:hypothetical protein
MGLVVADDGWRMPNWLWERIALAAGRLSIKDGSRPFWPG